MKFIASSVAPPRVDMVQFKRLESGYCFVGLRQDDIQEIRRWRNAQQDILRQQKPITKEDQEQWWKVVVTPAHLHPFPKLLLVSILDADRTLVGYGGLTNIDWLNRRAEISFLVSPDYVADSALYTRVLFAFWHFIRHWAFEELNLHRLFTETYDFRCTHIDLLERAGMTLEGRMRDHIKLKDGYADSLLHGLLSTVKD